MTTLAQLHALVDSLPPEGRDAAARLLVELARGAIVDGPTFFDSHGDGPPPVLNADAEPIADIDALKGGFWPDEDPDEFVEALRGWRRDESR